MWKPTPYGRGHVGLAMPVPNGLGQRPTHCYSFLSSCTRNNEGKEKAVSRHKKVSHTIWHCQYRIVCVLTYRYSILTGPIREWVHGGIQSLCRYAGCEVPQLNVQHDHAHLIVMVPPKLSISGFMGRLKGQTSIKLFKRFKELRKSPISSIISGQRVIVLTPLALMPR
jgi:REP element-mobilizing transposase RayT